MRAPRARAIGWAPFGIDYVAHANSPLGASRHSEESLAQFALNFRLVGPMMREVARLSLEGKLCAVAENTGEPRQTLELGRWKLTVTFGVPAFGNHPEPKGNPEPIGRAIAQLPACNGAKPGAPPAGPVRCISAMKPPFLPPV